MYICLKKYTLYTSPDLEPDDTAGSVVALLQSRLKKLKTTHNRTDGSGTNHGSSSSRGDATGATGGSGGGIGGAATGVRSGGNTSGGALGNTSINNNGGAVGNNAPPAPPHDTFSGGGDGAWSDYCVECSRLEPHHTWFDGWSGTTYDGLCEPCFKGEPPPAASPSPPTRSARAPAAPPPPTPVVVDVATDVGPDAILLRQWTLPPSFYLGAHATTSSGAVSLAMTDDGRSLFVLAGPPVGEGVAAGGAAMDVEGAEGDGAVAAGGVSAAAGGGSMCNKRFNNSACLVLLYPPHSSSDFCISRSSRGS